GGDASAPAEDYLRRVELGDRLNHYPRQMSGGEQQRVAIARAFAARPSILFADEPTGNLDTRTGERVIDLLFALNREEGTTLVLVTHDPGLAERCDRTLRLDHGLMVEG
ncbi:MAG: ABC transporter ATP-binding protein, partial [Halioglobus sp.]